MRTLSTRPRKVTSAARPARRLGARKPTSAHGRPVLGGRPWRRTGRPDPCWRGRAQHPVSLGRYHLRTQLKPTTEAQAIARAHRMGQVQSVQVHRLLSEDNVDQRITELLATKRALFYEFARVSDTANSTPDAVDLSEAELVREVIAAERERLAEETPAQG